MLRGILEGRRVLFRPFDNFAGISGGPAAPPAAGTNVAF
jgi:hypothetical protein